MTYQYSKNQDHVALKGDSQLYSSMESITTLSLNAQQMLLCNFSFSGIYSKFYIEFWMQKCTCLL